MNFYGHGKAMNKNSSLDLNIPPFKMIGPAGNVLTLSQSLVFTKRTDFLSQNIPAAAELSVKFDFLIGPLKFSMTIITKVL